MVRHDEDVPPLTDDEILVLRDIARNELRWKWVWALLRALAGWVAGTALFLYATYGFIADRLRGGGQ
jgi:hypothetical protein